LRAADGLRAADQDRKSSFETVIVVVARPHAGIGIGWPGI